MKAGSLRDALASCATASQKHKAITCAITKANGDRMARLDSGRAIKAALIAAV
jgi:hypothetical protein